MRQKKVVKTYQLTIDDVADNCYGVAKYNGKVIFVRYALLTEIVIAKRYKKNAKFEEADVKQIIKSSENRIIAKCNFYGICGGCSLQHLSSENQLQLKFDLLKKKLHLININAAAYLKPIVADSWGYRRKARLGVKFVHKKNKVLVGFRENKSAFLTDMSSCLVLHPVIGDNLDVIAKCIEQLSIKDKIAQIEVAISEKDSVLILRHLAPLTDNDKNILQQYAKKLDIKWYLQSGGIDTIKPLAEVASLSYTHAEHNTVINFLASDFTQVNFAINQKILNLVLKLLMVNNNDNILDLFCGLGNFSLPIAKYVNSVVGVEGGCDLVMRAIDNAKFNNITNAKFYTDDLFKEIFTTAPWLYNKKYNKVIIDPPRSGVPNIVKLLTKFNIEKLVYISCNTATFVRDSKNLLTAGFKLDTLTIADMFSHTSHIETIALFTK